jgi:hypothetical protein
MHPSERSAGLGFQALRSFHLLLRPHENRREGTTPVETLKSRKAENEPCATPATNVPKLREAQMACSPPILAPAGARPWIAVGETYGSRLRSSTPPGLAGCFGHFIRRLKPTAIHGVALWATAAKQPTGPGVKPSRGRLHPPLVTASSRLYAKRSSASVAGGHKIAARACCPANPPSVRCQSWRIRYNPPLRRRIQPGGVPQAIKGERP